MKKRFVIITASIIVLAFIVAIGIHAQDDQKSKTISTEQSNKNIPDKCKKCPSLSKCLEENKQTPATTNECQSSCMSKKCCKEATTKECKETGDVSCNKTKGCNHSSTCKKECSKKSS